MGGRFDAASGAVSLESTPVTDAQIQYLAAMPGLKKLSLRTTEVSDAAGEHLARIAGWSRSI